MRWYLLIVWTDSSGKTGKQLSTCTRVTYEKRRVETVKKLHVCSTQVKSSLCVIQVDATKFTGIVDKRLD